MECPAGLESPAGTENRVKHKWKYLKRTHDVVISTRSAIVLVVLYFFSDSISIILFESQLNKG